MGRVGAPFSIVLSAAALLIGGLGPSARANVGEAYGLGSRHSALGATGAADRDTPFAAYTNPASLSRAGAGTPEALSGSSNEGRFRAAYGIIAMDPSFTPIRAVSVENTTVSDQDTVRDVDTEYSATIGQVVALSYLVAPELWNLGVGVTTYLPFDAIASFDSGEPFVPEYPMYRSRTQRSQFDIGAGVEPAPGIRFGAGLHVGYKVTGGTNLYVTTEAGKPSSMRFQAKTKPKVSPYFGTLVALTDTLDAGLTVRLPLASTGELQVRSTAKIVGSFDLAFTGASTLVYDPLTVELGAVWRQAPGAATHLQVDFQRWSRFEQPAFTIANPTASECSTPCGLPVSPSDNPSAAFRDIFIPRVGQELAWSESVTLRVGYAYRPSILAAPPSGQGNLLDPGKHMFSLGTGYRFGSSEKLPWTLDAHFSYHLLQTLQITKAGTEIGAPGYEAGGKILGGGVSLSLAL